MNKTLILLFISLAVLVLSVICVTVAPIINNLLGNFASWGKNNCQYYSDEAKYTKQLDDKYKAEKNYNLCIRQKAMYGLEYSAFIFDLALGFLIGQLGLLHYFNAGKSFEKTTGLIGLIGGGIGFLITLIYVCFSGYIFNNDVALIGGGIGFLITLIYVCFSGYIFNNDVAFRKADGTGNTIARLYSNGAEQKCDGSTGVNVYSNEIDEDAQFAKYKDLGGEQYNYNKKRYEAYLVSTDCINSCTGCEYSYPINPEVEVKNKYLYDRWCLSLVLAVIITALNAGIVVFGFLFFSNKGDSGDSKPVEIK